VQRKKTIKKIFIGLAAAVGALVLIFIGLVVYFNLIRIVDISKQENHMEELRQLYSNQYTPVDEQQFVNFDLRANDLRLNEIQLLATHNSYKKYGSAIAKFLVGVVESFEEAESMKYGFNDLTDQLNHGVRSFELDLRYRSGDFEVTHVPLVDNSSTVPKFDLALEEIRLWSDHNPGHIPIIVLLELKGDWMILDPALSDFTGAELIELDDLIKEEFGDQLFTPADMIGSHDSLRQAVTKDGWPLLNDLLGQVIFFLHPGQYTEPFMQARPDFKTMGMFPAARDGDSDYASFIIHNNPHDLEYINELVASNYIVRTRLDSSLQICPERFQNGLLSGAQILTTDFGPNHHVRDTDYVAYLKDRYLIITNTYLAGQ